MRRQFGHVIAVRLDDELYAAIERAAERLNMRNLGGDLNLSGACRVLLQAAVRDEAQLDLADRFWAEARAEWQRQVVRGQEALITSFADEVRRAGQ